LSNFRAGRFAFTFWAGTDPLTGRQIRFRKTGTTERDAQIELRKLVVLAQDRRQPDFLADTEQFSRLLDQVLTQSAWLCLRAGKSQR
jgi:hypothetical protein